MDAGTQVIYDELCRVAKSRDITYYSTIAPLAGLDMGSPGDGNRISRILGDISTAEHDGGEATPIGRRDLKRDQCSWGGVLQPRQGSGPV